MYVIAICSMGVGDLPDMYDMYARAHTYQGKSCYICYVTLSLP